MKKYLLGFLAVAFALALNAFTSIKKPSPPKSYGPALIWYMVNGSNQIDTSAKVNPGDPKDADAFQDDYPGVCPSGDNAPCARGFLPNALPNGPSASGVQDIRKQ